MSYRILFRIFSIISALLVGRGAVAQDPPLFKFSEAPGPYGVGLKVVEQYDHSRTYRALTDDLGKPYSGERARPLQTLIWYPAQKSAAKPMTFGDYADLLSAETNFGSSKETIALSIIREVSAPSFSSLLWAVRDAMPASGRFPIVIYAPSFSGSAFENADLCEYWASHGYIVLASPAMGSSSRQMTSDLDGIRTQARDISFLIGYAGTLSDSDPSQVAVAGWSWGGMSNMFAAAHDNRIKALVSLDGTARYEPAWVKRAGDVYPEQMSIPLLFFTRAEPTLEEADAIPAPDKEDTQGANVLNAWQHGDLITVHMLGMTHQEFSSLAQRDERFWEEFSQNLEKADYGRKEGAIGYGWVAKYSLRFLDAYLKQDAEALVFLKRSPGENGAPRHFMWATYRSAKGVPPSLDAFRGELGKRGFSHAGDIYVEMTKENPDFKLQDEELNGWGWRLIDAKQFSEAIEVFTLNSRLYPSSSGATDSLGQAFYRAGQKQMALESFRKSLERNAEDQIAKNWIRILSSGE